MAGNRRKQKRRQQKSRSSWKESGFYWQPQAVLEYETGRQYWIRTSDLYDVNVAL